MGIAGAVIVLAERRAIGQAMGAVGEALTVMAVAVAVILVLVIAGFVLLGRHIRRNEGRVAAELAAHRTVPAASLRAVPAPTARVLPPVQPQTVIHHHWHGDVAGQVLRALSDSTQAGEQR